MDEDYSEEIFDIIRNFLVNDDWKFEFDEEQKLFRFYVAVDGRLKNLRYIIQIRSDSYSVYAFAPINADSKDENVMKEMAEFFCRVNYGLRCGGFDFDMNDGEIRYKVFVDCFGVMPTDSIIRRSITIPSLMFERYSPGLLNVMFAGSTAVEAIEKCE